MYIYVYICAMCIYMSYANTFALDRSKVSEPTKESYIYSLYKRYMI